MEEIEIYKNLLRTIRNNGYMDYLVKKYLIDYISDVKDGKRNNDFYEIDFLNKIVLAFVNRRNLKIEDFEKIIEVTKELLPLGLETPDYSAIKNAIINGNIYNEKAIFALFDNRLDYIQLMNIISKDDFLLEQKDAIINFAINVSPYCINQSELKAEIMAYINGLKKELGNIDEYTNKRINDARWKSGIYDIDEKTLTAIADSVRSAKQLIRVFDTMKKQVAMYVDTVNTATKNGKNEITRHTNSLISDFDARIMQEKQMLSKKLDEALANMEAQLRGSKNEIIDQVLAEANEQLKEIKKITSNLSISTTGELLRIQKASEQSIEKLRAVIDGPMLKEMLKETADYEGVKESLAKLEELLAKKNNQEFDNKVAGPQIYIPGNDRIVIPANPKVILPNREINDKIIPAFDESIPFDTRMKRIMAEKKKREASGELFHEMTDEVIVCLIEGDWPYLWGPSGCGKSYLIKQVASLLGFEVIENGKITDKYSIMAYNDPHGRFRATQAFIALVYGGLLSLDEFDNGNTDTQVVLNELYSGLLDVLDNPAKKRFVTFAEDMVVPINPNFRMISAGNTSGEGENQIFSSRGKIDEAVQERMTPKRFNYDNRVEKRIFDIYKSWYSLFVNFRKACDAYATQAGHSTAPGMITTRDAVAIVKYIKHNSKSVDQIMAEKFVQVKNADYLNVIINVMENTYGVSRNDVGVDIPRGTKLSSLNEKVLAKKLIYNCKQSIRD